MSSPSSILTLLLCSLTDYTLSQIPPPQPPIAPFVRPQIPPNQPLPPVVNVPQVPQPPTPPQPPVMPIIIPAVPPAPPAPPAPAPGSKAAAPTRPPIMGAFGQDCTPSSGDYPEACPVVGQDLFAVLGKHECIHNFDCCTCGAMICHDCTDLVCNGDSSCYGVRDMRLMGGDAGVNINCNGDVSCQKTGIFGSNVARILCSGDDSCSYSFFDLICLLQGCILECVGDRSCEADPSDTSLDAMFTIENSYGMSCSASACRYATFNLLSNLGGALMCGAYDACLGSKITVTNIHSIMCGGRHACKDANILVINPSNGFTLSCNSAGSCIGLQLEIVVTDPEITSFMSITCGAMNACENARITITKQLPLNTIIPSGGSNELVIQELGCGGYRACYNTHFYLTPNVGFGSCGCAGGMTQACDGLLGVESCAQGILRIECTGNSCKGMSETIINPKDEFELLCPDPYSCQDYTLTIRITDAANSPNRLNGVRCNSPNSCQGFRINIINLKSDGDINPLPAGNVYCDSTNSCQNAVIVTHNADIYNINCGTSNSCDQCQQWQNMKYNPCNNPPAIAI